MDLSISNSPFQLQWLKKPMQNLGINLLISSTVDGKPLPFLPVLATFSSLKYAKIFSKTGSSPWSRRCVELLMTVSASGMSTRVLAEKEVLTNRDQ